jgi:hypothetical protein
MTERRSGDTGVERKEDGVLKHERETKEKRCWYKKRSVETERDAERRIEVHGPKPRKSNGVAQAGF